CTAAGCLSSGSQMVKDNLEKSVKAAGLEDQIHVSGVGCMRLCCQGPLVQVDQENNKETKLYEQVTPEDAAKVIEAMQGKETDLKEQDLSQPFFTKQLPIVLENSGKVDPDRIQSYIVENGYQALYQVLREMKPTEVLETITKSGLRGRGGAGYPTGLKWATVAKSQGEKKFVICNADEGDPGAFMDRSVLESDPHRVLEGMAIAAYAVGASQGYIYVRAEYPTAIKRLETAIRQAQRLGLLGSQIFESPFDFKIEIRIGAGAYVCGEETA
ncbi:MAG: NAD(P)H-dependent oxidoreductase subunit E, partial [Sphaerospermopsis kisseleviana]